jgi:hypothetical protein
MDIPDSVLWLVERGFAYFGQGDVIHNIRTNRKNKKENGNHFKKILSFYQSKINLEFVNITSSEKFSQEQAFRYWIEHQTVLNNLTPSQKNIG